MVPTNNWKISFSGILELFGSEPCAYFWIEPDISTNGVYSGNGGFEVRVSIPCSGLEDAHIIGIERELKSEEIEYLKRRVLIHI